MRNASDSKDSFQDKSNHYPKVYADEGKRQPEPLSHDVGSELIAAAMAKDEEAEDKINIDSKCK